MGPLTQSRRRILQTVALSAVAVASGRASAATLEEIKKRGTLVVATEDDYRPFEFVKDGTPTGYDTELLKLFGKTVPFKVDQKLIPWTGLLPGVDSGRYDAAVTGALITKDRLAFLDFTSPVSEATLHYVKRANDASIKSIKDLNGKSVGVEAGSAMLAALPQLDAVLRKDGGKLGKVVQYVAYPEAYQDLAIGRIDYVSNTIINLALLLKERPGVFEIGSPIAAKTYIAWAVKKGNAGVLDLIDNFLADERKSGRMYAMQKQWLGQSFEDMPVSFVPS